MELDTDRKHKKLEKTKKLVFQKENVELLEACIESPHTNNAWNTIS